MRRFAAILSLIALSLACTPDSGEDAFLDELYRDLPFDMPRIALPAIPDRSVSLADFGGVGDGATLNTDAFARAISELERLGGGIIDTNAEGTKLKSLSYDRSYMTNVCIGYKFSF